MKGIILAILCACSVMGQAPHSPTRDEIKQALDSQTKEQIIQNILDDMFPPSLVGQTLPPYARAPKGPTIAVFLSSRCPHCSAIAPYLKTLAESAQAAGKVSLVPVFFGEDTGAALFWGGKFASFTREEASALRLKGTPTTAVADASGKITAVYMGELKPEERAALERIVREGL